MTETTTTAETAGLDLEVKVAIITGAASGIGKGIARRLAAEGARVAIADLNENAAQQTAEELGGDTMGVPVDVADRATVDAMVTQVTDRYGTIDILTNNAGWDKIGPFLEQDPAV